MPEFIVEIVCESDPSHRSRVRVEGVSREYAEQLAGLMHGTSEFYVYLPRDNPTPGSELARCQLCGAWIQATVKEETDNPLEQFFIAHHQPGPLRVMDQEGRIWQAFKHYRDIPNYEQGPHVAMVLARLAPEEAGEELSQREG